MDTCKVTDAPNKLNWGLYHIIGPPTARDPPWFIRDERPEARGCSMGGSNSKMRMEGLSGSGFREDILTKRPQVRLSRVTLRIYVSKHL